MSGPAPAQVCGWVPENPICPCPSMWLSTWEPNLSLPKYVVEYLRTQPVPAQVCGWVPENPTCPCPSMWLSTWEPNLSLPKYVVEYLRTQSVGFWNWTEYLLSPVKVVLPTVNKSIVSFRCTPQVTRESWNMGKLWNIEDLWSMGEFWNMENSKIWENSETWKILKYGKVLKYQKILKYRRIPETWENLKRHMGKSWNWES